MAADRADGNRNSYTTMQTSSVRHGWLRRTFCLRVLHNMARIRLGKEGVRERRIRGEAGGWGGGGGEQSAAFAKDGAHTGTRERESANEKADNYEIAHCGRGTVCGEANATPMFVFVFVCAVCVRSCLWMNGGRTDASKNRLKRECNGKPVERRHFMKKFMRCWRGKRHEEWKP